MSELAEAVAEGVADQKTVVPSQLSDEALDKLIQEQTTEPEVDAVRPEPEKTATEPQAVVPPTPPEVVAPTVPDASALQAEIEKLRRQVEEKEKLVKRHAAEVGVMRKMADKIGLDSGEKIDPDKFATDPEGYTKDYISRQQARESLKTARLDTEAYERRNAIITKLPDIESHIEEMVTVARELGAKEPVIEQFRQTWWQDDMNTIVPLYVAAKERKEKRTLSTKVAELEGQVKSLSKRPGDMIRRVAAAAAAEPMLNGRSGESSSERAPIDVSQLPSLSDAELDTVLAEATRKARTS